MSFIDKGIIKPLFRCKRCGQEFTEYELIAENKDFALWCISRFLKGEKIILYDKFDVKWEIKEKILHHCDDKKIGIAEIIGFN